MTTRERTEPLNNNVYHIVVSILFGAFLLLPALSGFWGENVQSTALESENRNKEVWPDWHLFGADTKGYTAQVNRYLEDHVGFRQPFLSLYAKTQYRLFNLGISEKVVIGQDGWLFYADDNVMESTEGKMPFSDEQAKRWMQSMLELRRYIEAYGGRLVVLVVPEKDRVYPEYLPSHLQPTREGRRADILERYAQELGVTYINLLDSMIEYKSSGQLYLKSDSHWTQRGAYVAYRELVKAVQQEQSVVIPFDPWHRLLENGTKTVSGDLAKLLNLCAEFEEVAAEHIPVHKQEGHVRSLDDKPSLLVIGDSFSARIHDFLPSSFIGILFVHHHFSSIPMKMIAKRKPDIVVVELIERALKAPFTLDQR